MRDIAQQHIAKFTSFLRLFSCFVATIFLPNNALAVNPFANVGTAVVNEGESTWNGARFSPKTTKTPPMTIG